jgi:hypothetical protein
MALEKPIDTVIGIPATYWKITFQNMTFATPDAPQQSGCILKGWADKDAREQFSSLAYRSFVWQGDDVPLTRDEAYAAIKLTSEFQGAVDV